MRRRGITTAEIGYTHEDCDSGLDLEFKIVGYANPPEPQTRDYPGCPASMEDISATLVGIVDADSCRRLPTAEQAVKAREWFDLRLETDAGFRCRIEDLLFAAADAASEPDWDAIAEEREMRALGL